jgi:hypothetical protein
MHKKHQYHNQTRPSLNNNICVDDFKNFYWLKKELHTFCKIIGVSASGGKIEITNRIIKYLETGVVEGRLKKAKSEEPAAHISCDTPEDLTLETTIPKKFKCSKDLRHFLKSVIGPHFHFSILFQNWCKNNTGKTYADAVMAWNEEEKRKKDADYKTIISSQFKYNQFIRDFFNDPANKDKKLSDAIDAWKLTKNLPGTHTYVSFKKA